MITITISGNTFEELYGSLEAMLETKPRANLIQMPQAAVSISPQPSIGAPAVPAVSTAEAVPAAAAQGTVVPAAAPMPAVPVAAPAYTLEQLARAGAALAQAGKMEQALALLARYNVQAVSQLRPEQYGAFATELRALGAQL